MFESERLHPRGEVVASPEWESRALVSERQQAIIELAERRGYVSIDSLAAHFDVTRQTIRRDINELCELHLLIRQHGGASLPVMNVSYSQRNVEFIEEKRRIAEAVCDYLPDRASIFMSLGTTVEAVARALVKSRKQLSIVTNSIEVARIMWTESDFETVVTGGIIQQRNGGLIGQKAVEVVSDYRCDYFISGIGGIEPSGALLDFYDGEIAVMRAMKANARQYLLVADHTKFQRTAKQRFMDISEVNCLFTDRNPPEALSNLVSRSGCEVVIAGIEEPIRRRAV